MFTPKQWMVIVASGALSALVGALAAFGSFGGFLLAYFCQLPLFLVGLSMGTVASALAAAVAGSAVIVMGGLFGALLFTLLNAAPVVILVRQALLFRTADQSNVEWYPAGLLAAAATIIGLTLMLLAFLALGTTAEGVEGTIRQFLDQFAQRLPGDWSDDARQQFVAAIAPLLPGSIGLSWLVMLVINGALAQGLLVRFGHNLRPSPDFAGMELPRWLPVVTAVLVVGAIVLPGAFGLFARSTALVAALPFFLVGLAVIHALARRVAAGSMLLILFYILMLLFGWPVVIVAFLGLVEQMAELRKRLAHAGEEK